MTAAAADLNAWGRPVVVLGGSPGTLRLLGHPGAEQFSGAVFGTDPNGRIRTMLAAPGDALPLVAMCDSFGRIVYLSKGYNTSLAADLRRILPQCR